MNLEASNAAMPPVNIHVDDLVMRRADHSDPTLKYQAIQKNRQFWGEFFGEMLQQDLSAVEQEYDRAKDAITAGIAAPYDVYQDKVLVAGVALHARKGNQAQLGYYVDKDYLRADIATRVGRRLADFGLNEWGLHSVTLLIRPGNQPSQGVALRLGARRKKQEWHEDGEGWMRLYDIWDINKGRLL